MRATDLGLLQYAHLAEEWLLSRVISVSARKLFYVQDGRNAWHSTWVERRYNDSYRLDFEAAKIYAEDSRTCGSVFLIVEVPCLAFETNRGYLFTTQIKADVPFKNFCPPKDKEDLINKLQKIRTPFMNEERLKGIIKSQIERYTPDGKIRTLRTLEKHLSIFKGKLFWTLRNKDSSITVMMSPKDQGEPLIIKKGEKMRTWKSSSIGSDYSLEWHEISPFYKSRGAIKASSHYD
jgi:hypothetical protein